MRTHIAAKDEIGRTAERLIKAGKLVPDDLVNQLVEKRLREPDAKAGMILDGYPRTLQQAHVLLELLSLTGFRPVVIHLVVDHDKIVARLSGRRQCPVCGTLYSLTTNPPRVPGVCDLDGTGLVTREDDQESVIRERLHEYDSQTVPILNFFREADVTMLEIDAGDAAPDQVMQRVCNSLAKTGLVGSLESTIEPLLKKSGTR